VIANCEADFNWMQAQFAGVDITNAITSYPDLRHRPSRLGRKLVPPQAEPPAQLPR
jgi:hypothetical protein